MNSPRSEFSSPYSFAAALSVMIICAVGCGIIQYYTPWQMDDVNYGRFWKDAMLGNAPGLSFSEGVDWFIFHWYEINGRFGDKLLVWMMTDLPKWLIGVIAAVSCMSLFWFGCKIAFVSVRRHPYRSILLTGMMMCLLPWPSYIFVTNMFVNYALGSAVLIIPIYLFVQEYRVKSLWVLTALSLLSAIAFAWHEGGGVPAFAGLLAYLLVKRKAPNALQWSILAGAVIGILFILCSPSIWDRVDYEEMRIVDQTFNFNNFIKGANFALLLPLVYFNFLAVPRLRRRLSSYARAAGALAMGEMLVTLFIYIRLLQEQRVFWYSDTIALPTLAMLLLPFGTGISKHIKQIVLLALCLFLTIHISAAVCWQRMLNREFFEIWEAYGKSEDGIVVYDYHGRGFGPAITLRKARLFSLSYDMRGGWGYREWFRPHNPVFLSLIPPELKDFDPHSFTQKPHEVIYYKGFAISNDSATLDGDTIIMMNFFHKSDPNPHPYTTLVNRFRAKDGSRLYYLEPDERQSGGAEMEAAELLIE